MKTGLFRGSALLLAMAGVLLSACSSTPAPPEGAVQGTLRMTVGLVALRDNGAIPGRVTATNRQGRAYAAAVPPSGRFTLPLPPGTYRLDGRSPKFISDGVQGVCTGGAVSVRSGKVVTLDVTCQGM